MKILCITFFFLFCFPPRFSPFMPFNFLVCPVICACVPAIVSKNYSNNLWSVVMLSYSIEGVSGVSATCGGALLIQDYLNSVSEVVIFLDYPCISQLRSAYVKNIFFPPIYSSSYNTDIQGLSTNFRDFSLDSPLSKPGVFPLPITFQKYCTDSQIPPLEQQIFYTASLKYHLLLGFGQINLASIIKISIPLFYFSVALIDIIIKRFGPYCSVNNYQKSKALFLTSYIRGQN